MILTHLFNFTLDMSSCSAVRIHIFSWMGRGYLVWIVDKTTDKYVAHYMQVVV